MKSYKTKIIVVLLSLYVLGGVILFLIQKQLLFYPQKLDPNHTFQYNAQEIFLQREDDVTLHGLLFKTEEPQGLMLYFHGNEGNLDSWGDACKVILEQNYNCLMFDYRGYGKSTGTIDSKEQFLEDANAIYDYAKTNYLKHKISLYGRSLGTAAASYLASQYEVEHVILESSPYCFQHLIQEKVMIYPTFAFFRFNFENNIYLEQNTNNTLLFHGIKDEVIPYSHFLNLQRDLPHKTNITFSSISNAAHNNIDTFPQYKKDLTSFLQKNTK